MVTAIDLSIPINNTSALEKGVPAPKDFPLIELAKIKRVVTLVRVAYQMVYQVYGKLPKNREVRPPLGLLYVAGALEAAGHKVRIIDADPQMLSADEILYQLMLHKPDVVGLTATTPEIDGVQLLCRMIKAKDRKIVIMVGGAHISSLPRETMKACPDIDYAVVGEGEVSAVHIVNNLPDENIIRSENVPNADMVPLPARHLLDYRWYKYAQPGKGLVPMDVVESIRGCPFMCTFCSVRGVKPRARNVVKVVDEIEYSHNKYGTRFVMFFDDTLTVNRDHVFRLCDEIIRRGLNKKMVFYANARANTTSPEMLDRLIEAGVTEMSMGVETGNNAMMKSIRKGCKTEQYEKAYKWMFERGLQTRASFLVGLPYETHESVRETIDFAKKLDLMRCSVNILTPYPGTHTYKQALAHDGIHLLCGDWREFKRWGTAVIRTDDLTAEDLQWYQKRFLTEFYTQPKVLWYHLIQIMKGNFSLYFFRPLMFAVKNRILNFLTQSRPPTWKNYMKRKEQGYSMIAINSNVTYDDPTPAGREEDPTGLEEDLIPVNTEK